MPNYTNGANYLNDLMISRAIKFSSDVLSGIRIITPRVTFLGIMILVMSDDSYRTPRLQE